MTYGRRVVRAKMRRRRRRKGVTADKSTFGLMLLRWDRVMGLLDGRDRRKGNGAGSDMINRLKRR